VDHEGSKLVNFIRWKSSGTLHCELGKQVPAFRRNVMSSSDSSVPSYHTISRLPPTRYLSIISVFVTSPNFSHSIVVLRPVHGSTRFPLPVRDKPGTVAEVQL
jgi:hypothetical protein